MEIKGIGTLTISPLKRGVTEVAPIQDRLQISPEIDKIKGWVEALEQIPMREIGIVESHLMVNNPDIQAAVVNNLLSEQL